MIDPRQVFILALLYAALSAPCALAHSDAAVDLAHDAIIVDTHIDVPYRMQSRWVDVAGPAPDGDFDFPRARAGGLDVAFMSIYTPAEIDPQEGSHWQLANELIDAVQALAWRAPGQFALADSPATAREAVAAGRIALVLGMENGSPIGTDLANLRFFHDRGIRYITLAHSRANAISDSSYDEDRPNGGLSPFGRQVVAEMNRLGVMVDVSHLTDDAIRDVLDVSRAPVIASHSSARHFTPGWERNISDELIVAVARGGGVIGINFGSSFLRQDARDWSETFSTLRDEKRDELDAEALAAWSAAYREEHPYPYAAVGDVLDHIDHVVHLAGIDHVGLGSDYDGVGDSLPVGLKDPSELPKLVDGLLERGYEEGAIRKILGENFLRVWQAVEDAAAR